MADTRVDRSVGWAIATYVAAILLLSFFGHNFLGAFVLVTLFTAIYAAILAITMNGLISANRIALRAAQAALISPAIASVIGILAVGPIVPTYGLAQSILAHHGSFELMPVMSAIAAAHQRMLWWARGTAVILMLVWCILVFPKRDYPSTQASIARWVMVLAAFFLA